MQIFSRFDSVFVIFYSLLIIAVGWLVFLISGQALALLSILPLLALYLSLALQKPFQRRRAAGSPFPLSWHHFLLVHSAYYRGLDERSRNAFARDIRLFLADDVIAGIGGAPVTWQTRLLIAAGVATMLHGRPEWELPLRDGITVYPGLSFDRNYQVEKGNIAGQAPAGGPLLVAEESLKQGFADPSDGYNVLIHELAHLFDREARKAGMRPRLGSGCSLDSWENNLTRQWQKHVRDGSILPSYAALNEAEFFAVASEMFFENPGSLAEAHPELFQLLRDFYYQDPRQVLF